MTHLGTTGVAQVVECLPCKCEILNTQPSTTKTNKQKSYKKVKESNATTSAIDKYSYAKSQNLIISASHFLKKTVIMWTQSSLNIFSKIKEEFSVVVLRVFLGFKFRALCLINRYSTT
jgi:hypothetical protein